MVLYKIIDSGNHARNCRPPGPASAAAQDGPVLLPQVIDFLAEHTLRFDRHMAGKADARAMLNIELTRRRQISRFAILSLSLFALGMARRAVDG